MIDTEPLPADLARPRRGRVVWLAAIAGPVLAAGALALLLYGIALG